MKNKIYTISFSATKDQAETLRLLEIFGAIELNEKGCYDFKKKDWKARLN